MKTWHPAVMVGVGTAFAFGLLAGIVAERKATDLVLRGSVPAGERPKDDAPGFLQVEPGHLVRDGEEPAFPVAGRRPDRLTFVPGPNAFPIRDGWLLTVSEPVQDPKVSSLGLVTLRCKLTNARPERVRRFELLDHQRAFDDFGNAYQAWAGEYHHRVQTLYPNESSRDREVEWVYDRPVPGATVTYEFGLDGRIGVVKKFWPVETKP